MQSVANPVVGEWELFRWMNHTVRNCIWSKKTNYTGLWVDDISNRVSNILLTFPFDTSLMIQRDMLSEGTSSPCRPALTENLSLKSVFLISTVCSFSLRTYPLNAPLSLSPPTVLHHSLNPAVPFFSCFISFFPFSFLLSSHAPYDLTLLHLKENWFLFWSLCETLSQQHSEEFPVPPRAGWS